MRTSANLHQPWCGRILSADSGLNLELVTPPGKVRTLARALGNAIADRIKTKAFLISRSIAFRIRRSQGETFGDPS